MSVEVTLAKQAKVEIFVQCIRIIKTLMRNRREKDIISFLEAIKDGNSKIRTWEIDIDGIRSKRLFKKSIAILRNLIGDLAIYDILPPSDISYMENMKCVSLVDEAKRTIPKM